MLYQHLLDCLAIIPYVGEAKHIVDVGSGGGLPGIPLALVFAASEITLLDSSHKKTAFLRQACIELALTNTTIVCERVELWQPPQPVDLVVSRAFSELKEFANLAGHLLAPGATMMAMKGLYPYDELTNLPSQISLQQVIPLQIPGMAAQRHLVILKESA